MTKDEILEFVKNAGLKPADIVAKSNGLIPVTQAYDWLRTWKFSMSTLLLLEVYAKRATGSAEIFSEPRPTLIEQAKPYVDAAVDANIRLKVAMDSARVTEPVLPPLINKSATEKLLAEKIQAKTKNMKKENPYLEERVIYEGPSTDSIADFIESASKMPVNPNTVFRDMEYGNIGDILPLTPFATPTNFASWGVNMTMKRVGNIVKLNTNDKSYTIDFEKAKSGFLVDGKKYLLSDFKEV